VVRAMSSARQRIFKHALITEEECFLCRPRLYSEVSRITESTVESTRTEEYKDENGACPSDL
jgi:hypothetical protein